MQPLNELESKVKSLSQEIENRVAGYSPQIDLLITIPGVDRIHRRARHAQISGASAENVGDQTLLGQALADVGLEQAGVADVSTSGCWLTEKRHRRHAGKNKGRM